MMGNENRIELFKSGLTTLFYSGSTTTVFLNKKFLLKKPDILLAVFAALLNALLRVIKVWRSFATQVLLHNVFEFHTTHFIVESPIFHSTLNNMTLDYVKGLPSIIFDQAYASGQADTYWNGRKPLPVREARGCFNAIENFPAPSLSVFLLSH